MKSSIKEINTKIEQLDIEEKKLQTFFQTTHTNQYVEHYQKTRFAFITMVLYVIISNLSLANSILSSSLVVSAISLISIGVANGYVAWKHHHQRKQKNKRFIEIKSEQNNLMIEKTRLQKQNQTTVKETYKNHSDLAHVEMDLSHHPYTK